MKKRRHKLQVSTFPFLAVLLCAMGSLILLLLVIDRRAKQVARAKALQAIQQSETEDARLDAARQAEWERQRQALHARLTQQDQQLLTQVSAVEGEIHQTTKQLATMEDQRRSLHSKIHDETAILLRRQADVAARRAKLAEAAQLDEGSRSQMVRLTAELQTLEQTLADLRAAREEQEHTYSLVPYRGRQGENRRPVYVECTAHGLIFHPDRLAFEGPSITSQEIRAEVERRIARQGDPPDPANGDGAKNPYVLMLVRPDGIDTYYRLLAALDGLKIDFGYEFIERDWVLDFANDQEAGKPWLADGSPSSGPPATRPPLNLSRPANPTAGVPGQSPSGSQVTQRDIGTSGEPSGPGASGGENPSSSWPRFRSLRRSQLERPGMGSGGSLLAEGSMSESSSGHGTAPGPGGSPLSTMSAKPAESPSGLGTGISPGGGAGTGPSFQVAVLSKDPAGFSAAGRPGGAFVPLGPGTADQSTAPADVVIQGIPARSSAEGGAGTARLSEPNADPIPSPPAGSQTPRAAGQAGGASLPESVVAAGMIPPTGSMAASPNGAGSPQESPGISGRSSNPGTNTNPAGLAGGTRQGEGDMEPPDNPLAALTGPMTQPKPPRTPVMRPGMLTANRDWFIQIECGNEGVVLNPTRLHFSLESLEDSGAGDALLRAVQQMIQRRQASVYPGEPPYRPMIRFLVRPDGLRSYYTAYPVLEKLHLPMSRENYHPDE